MEKVENSGETRRSKLVKKCEGKCKKPDSKGKCFCCYVCMDTGKCEGEMEWERTVRVVQKQNATYLFGHGSMRTQHV